jgi:DNA adenine methylase
MPKNSPKDAYILDWVNTDVSPTVSANQFRDAQSHLYRIENPYVGNKRKIVVDIAKSLETHDFKFDSVLDLFSGSGMVSLFFKLLGKQVTSNDLLTSSYYNALVFVGTEKSALSKEQVQFLCENKNASVGDFVQKNYAERFTPREAAFLDNYRANVETLPTPAAKANALVLIEHYVLKHCFLGGRLNSGQILAKLDHRLNHDRNGGREMSFKLTLLPHFDGPVGHSLNLDCLDALKAAGSVDLAYIDPPYGSSQSDYAFMFSFCEEYVYSNSINTLPHIANSKKFTCSKEYETHFKGLLDAAKHLPQWAISYNDSSWADIDTISKLVKDFKKDVIVVNIDYEYKYRKEKESATEYLVLAR